MKAKEVLKRYAAGERSFQGVNLRGQSFKGKDLSDADFSEADIRSTNFTDANLRGTNFTGVQCGLRRRWVTLLTTLSWLLGFVLSMLSISTGALVSLIIDFDLGSQITGWVSLLVISLFIVVTIRYGIIAGAGVFTGAGVFAVLGAFALTDVGVETVTRVGLDVLAFIETASILSGGAGGFIILKATTVARGVVEAGIVVVAAVLTVTIEVIGVYISWLAMRGDQRDPYLCSLVITFTSIGGTSFRNAYLTDANFSDAKLKSTDLRNAVLIRVNWHGAKMLDRIRPGDSYLQSSQLQQWLIGKGVEKNFDGQKLQGINLQGADLTDASFVDSNLSGANLQDTNLSNAKLIQTQLDKTDFTGATLTGACIEDWGITNQTKLDQVKCKYIFMRSPTPDNPNPRRKPDNWEEEFSGNDFGDFIQPIFDTLDLYHNQGVDPRAIAISWKELAENHPDANLKFAAMEVKGENSLLLRLKADSNADLSGLNAEYFTTYNQIKALTEAESQKLIAEKDDRIKALENMLNTALEHPKTLVNQNGNFGIGHMNDGEIKENAQILGTVN